MSAREPAFSTNLESHRDAIWSRRRRYPAGPRVSSVLLDLLRGPGLLDLQSQRTPALRPRLLICDEGFS